MQLQCRVKQAGLRQALQQDSEAQGRRRRAVPSTAIQFSHARAIADCPTHGAVRRNTVWYCRFFSLFCCQYGFIPIYWQYLEGFEPILNINSWRVSKLPARIAPAYPHDHESCARIRIPMSREDGDTHSAQQHKDAFVCKEPSVLTRRRVAPRAQIDWKRVRFSSARSPAPLAC